jgi:adenosylcobinamide-GDP ribazoletransferase
VSHELGVRSVEPSLPRRIEQEVVAAFAFLTRLPVGTTTATIGAGAFGLVGAAIGVLGAVGLVIVGGAAPIAAGALALAVMAVTTGALHLDGLGDTADALAVSTPEAAERARVDPRLGSAGVAAIGLVLLVDASLLGTFVERAGLVGAALACVTAACVSRVTAVLAAWSQRRRARPGGGAWLVSQLSAGATVATLTTAVLVALTSSVLAGSLAIALGALVGALAGVGAAAWLVRMRAGLDGDVLGATVELTFAAVLLAIVLVP